MKSQINIVCPIEIIVVTLVDNPVMYKTYRLCNPLRNLKPIFDRALFIGEVIGSKL